ncbi:MAG: trypsin-like peptidase domain-containing protein [Leptospiraceae bacterium]|nr:trypsin-like peptidase domain-containing protein [Leptospiraceae bacterium]MDW7976884.1 trypsin-like peptidase domain-containing protein [Leptospiraceae bacterium]
MSKQKKYLINYFKLSFFLYFLLIVLSSCINENTTFLKEVYAESPLKNKKNFVGIYELQQRFYEIYELYKDSVVFISTEKTVRIENPFYNDPFLRRFFNIPQLPETQKQRGLGTGFIISSDGYICTNHHVIAGMDVVKVSIKGKEYNAKIVGSDRFVDIALLKVDGVKDLQPVYFGDSDKVKVGDWAIAIGNPFGLDRTFTVGVISAVARKDVDQMGNSHIQTDASINPGNSGGPLINIDGEVIGVNRMIYSQTGGNLGIGFAIPINTAKTVIEQLRLHGKVKRGYIGIQIASLTEELAQELGVRERKGVVIISILENSPADKAKLQVGDVILSANDKEVNEPDDLIRIVNETPIGKIIKLRINRKNQILTVMVVVEERPQ